MSRDEGTNPDPHGLSLRKRGDSFQFDRLIDSLGEDRSSQLATSLTSSAKVTSPSILPPPDDTAPTIPIVKNKSTRKTNEKPGFFKRLFSSSNNHPQWASQAENHIREESSWGSTFTNAANTAGKATRPVTAASAQSTVTSALDSIVLDDAAPGSRRHKLPIAEDASATQAPSPHVPLHPEERSLSINPVLSTGQQVQAETVLAPFVDRRARADSATTPYGIPRATTNDKRLQEQSLPEGWRSTSPPGVNLPGPNEKIDSVALQPVLKDVSGRSPVLSYNAMLEDVAQYGVLYENVPAQESSPNAEVQASIDQLQDSNDQTAIVMKARAKAEALYDWQDELLHPADYAAYLGADKDFNKLVREAYVHLFDFGNISIIRALRQFCAKLYIRGETQVLDRILESFSARWRQCNMTDQYLTQDVTHIMSFALITLNTDLHIANVESDQKMRRSAFTNNTMEAILSVTNANSVTDVPSQLDQQSDSGSKQYSTTLTNEQTIRCVPRSTSLGGSAAEEMSNSNISGTNHSTVVQPSEEAHTNASVPLRRKLTLRRSPSSYLSGNDKSINSQAREAYLRDALQDMYLSVKHEQIRQPDLSQFDRLDSADSSQGPPRRPPPLDSRSLHGGSRARSLRLGDMLSRNSSMISLNLANEYMALKNNAKRQFDKDDTASSPRGRQKPSFSLTSDASETTQRGIGFANSLNNVMIREEATTELTSPIDMVEAIEAAEEDDLMLYGAPFAKEGRLSHKVLDQALSKKSRSKQWTSDTFAVVSRGEIKLFDFSPKTLKNNRNLYGGGDWTQNARSLLNLSLIQTVAAALPEGSYLKERPHVWALTMPDGVVHLFHVGTEELVQEWINTANYWAARITKEPLLGAVDNTEYGWGSCLEHLLRAEGTNLDSVAQTPTTITSDGLSKRDSISDFSIKMNPDATRFDDIVRKYPGNRAVIRDWSPETVLPQPSDLPQDLQLSALQKFVSKLDLDMRDQAYRRSLLPQAFSQHHPNLVKARANFEKRKQHWESEMVKYKTYIEALEHGMRLAEEVRLEKHNKNLKDLQGQA